jgi:hypothetical protein
MTEAENILGEELGQKFNETKKQIEIVLDQMILNFLRYKNSEELVGFNDRRDEEYNALSSFLFKQLHNFFDINSK